jgi:hypothetical protein
MTSPCHWVNVSKSVPAFPGGLTQCRAPNFIEEHSFLTLALRSDRPQEQRSLKGQLSYYREVPVALLDKMFVPLKGCLCSLSVSNEKARWSTNKEDPHSETLSNPTLGRYS